MTAVGMHASQWARVVLDELEIDLSRNAAHLVETLAHIANETGEAWPSLDRLMRRMRLGRTAVKDARSELVAVGLLKPTGANRGGRRRSDGTGITARYALALPAYPHGFAVHNRPPRRPVDDVDAVHNRPPAEQEPAAPAAAKSHEVPLVLTNRDALRAVPTNSERRFPMTITVDPVPTDATWDDYYAPVGMDGGTWDVR
jgi:hypothetical protein